MRASTSNGLLLFSVLHAGWETHGKLRVGRVRPHVPDMVP
ncbi:hypothetical protein PhaeoP14_02610 [Phaeobacter piscinae]|nr:hypothetical protein PhaeoP14_02610 [Phaeobacter piscinae]